MSDFAQFQDLPVELLPLVVLHVVRPSHLAALCLVNKTFYTFAVPLLYERVFIYAWHKEGKYKACRHCYYCGHPQRIGAQAMHQVIKLFRTLAEYAHLATLVQQLGKSLGLGTSPLYR